MAMAGLLDDIDEDEGVGSGVTPPGGNLVPADGPIPLLELLPLITGLGILGLVGPLLS